LRRAIVALSIMSGFGRFEIEAMDEDDFIAYYQAALDVRKQF